MRTLRHLHLSSLATAGVAVLSLLSALGCTTSTEPTSVAARRAQWEARGIVSYRFDFHQTGFFINCTGPQVQIDVKNGAVDGVTQSPSGQPLDVTACWPTVEQLFDRAEAAQGGALTHIEYDPTLGYPTVIEMAGPPDAAGSYFAANLRLLPEVQSLTRSRP